MLFLAENNIMYGVIGVAGVAVIILFSLGLAFVTLWTCSENNNWELNGLTWVFGAWLFGVATILFITTTIQGIL